MFTNVHGAQVFRATGCFRGLQRHSLHVIATKAARQSLHHRELYHAHSPGTITRPCYMPACSSAAGVPILVLLSAVAAVSRHSAFLRRTASASGGNNRTGLVGADVTAKKMLRLLIPQALYTALLRAGVSYLWYSLVLLKLCSILFIATCWCPCRWLLTRTGFPKDPYMNHSVSSAPFYPATERLRDLLAEDQMTNRPAEAGPPGRLAEATVARWREGSRQEPVTTDPTWPPVLMCAYHQ